MRCRSARRKAVTVPGRISLKTKERYTHLAEISVYDKDFLQLFSPGYPAYYGANLSCSYYLSVDDDRLVVLRFDNVLLADGDQIQLFEEDDIVPSRM